MNLPQSHKTLGNLARALFSINILYVITYLYRISLTSLGDSFGKLGTDFFFFLRLIHVPQKELLFLV